MPWKVWTADTPGHQAAVNAWPVAVGEDDRNVELTNQADGQQQVAKAQAAPRELRDSEPERLEALKENPVARRADHHFEPALGKLADKVVDLLRSAAGSRGGHQLEDTDAAAHVSQALLPPRLPAKIA
jgi:hypothetical protein